jgi:hypothetical protein
VIVVSALERAAEEPMCLQLSASAYVAKSPDITVYFAGVKAAVQRWLNAVRPPDPCS